MVLVGALTVGMASTAYGLSALGLPAAWFGGASGWGAGLSALAGWRGGRSAWRAIATLSLCGVRAVRFQTPAQAVLVGSTAAVVGGLFVVNGSAVMAAPARGLALRVRNWWGRRGMLVLGLGIVVAILSVFARDGQALTPWGGGTPVWERTRAEEFASNRPELAGALATFDQIVPPDATVARHLPEASYEYPLFGKGLTKGLVPINPFYGPPVGPPRGADFFLYAGGYPSLPGDIDLGGGVHLRALSAPASP